MSASDIAQKRAFIRQQVEGYSGDKKVQADNVYILCPNHSEKTPSAVISLNEDKYFGRIYCFSCKYSAPYDEWAPKAGLLPYKKGPAKDQQVEANALLVRLQKMKRQPSQEEDTFIQEKMRSIKKLDKDDEWRGISTNLLRKLGARTAEFYKEETDKHDAYWSKRMLYLPCHIEGELVGYIKARLKKEPDKPSYVNAKGNWSKSQGIFPFDYAVALAHKIADKYGVDPTIVLVEGQRDALRLLEMGIPACSILGTQSWTNNKAKLFAQVNIQHLLLLMDGDCAGKKATYQIIEDLKKQRFVSFSWIGLWKVKGSPWLKFQHKRAPSSYAKDKGVELWDPGNCPRWILKEIKRGYFR